MSSAHAATSSTSGRANLEFSDERDIDQFVDMLGRYERGEATADEWRRFRLLRGTYAQRQDGVQMLRIKLPQGIASSKQLRALADVAIRYSRGFAHITTRQNVQYHFVPLPDVEPAMRHLAAAGLTSREACGNSVRNVTGCPYAGTSSDEVFDVTPYAERMTRYFLRHPLSGILPRKFKIAFEGCLDDHIAASINDIGFRARIQNGQRGFRVSVAGSTSIMAVSGYLLHEFIPVEDMLNVAEAVARVFRKYGDFEHKQRNRLKFVVKAIGWDAFRAHVEEERAAFVAAGGASLNFDPDTVAPLEAPTWIGAAPRSLDEVAATIATPVRGPGIVPGSVRLQPRSNAYLRWCRTNVSPQRQEGYCHVTVRLPLGDFTAGQLRVLADLADAYGDGTVRLTMQQNVLFKWIGGESVEALYQRLVAAGLAAPDAETIGDIVSCPGAESCRLAVTQSRGLGRLLTEHLSARPDLIDLVPSGDIKVSGCPNGCGQHHIASIGFQGSVRKVAGRAVPQYFVLAGGGCSDDGTAHFGKVVAKVPVHRVPEALDRLLDLYRRECATSENLGAFFRRLSPRIASDLLSDLSSLAPDNVRPEDIVDLGEDRAFAPEIMEGECAS